MKTKKAPERSLPGDRVNKLDRKSPAYIIEHINDYSFQKSVMFMIRHS